MILSNACNLKCRSCTPSHSNLWQAEFKKIYGNTGYTMKFDQSGNKNGILWKNRHEWMQSVVNLEIVGGEPFYIQQWNDIWEEFVASGRSKEINISLSSNATIFAGERVKFLNDNFKLVGLGLSIDGLDQTYEYLRYPGKWDEVQENLFKYNAMKVNGELENTNISISHTIGWINAWHLPQFVEWIHSNMPKFIIWYNLIHSPDHMALWALPQKAKNLIEDRWNNSTLDKDIIKGLINHMNSRSPNDTQLMKMYSKFHLIDLARDQKTKTFVVPEILEYIEEFLPMIYRKVNK
jgi:sulfatase maturation enzyme AslB (radical SAM superfamily)